MVFSLQDIGRIRNPSAQDIVTGVQNIKESESRVRRNDLVSDLRELQIGAFPQQQEAARLSAEDEAFLDTREQIRLHLEAGSFDQAYRVAQQSAQQFQSPRHQEDIQQSLDLLTSGNPQDQEKLKSYYGALRDFRVGKGDLEAPATQAKPKRRLRDRINPETGEREQFLTEDDQSVVPGSTFTTAPAPTQDTDKIDIRIRKEYVPGEGTYEVRTENGVPVPGTRNLIEADSAAGAAEKTKPFADMPFEGRTKLGLVTNADKMAVLAEPHLFDEDGNFRNWASITPTSDARNSRKRLKEALTNMLRVESGAAIKPDEIADQAELMMPGFTDHDSTAKIKWSILKQKIASMHTAMTSGYSGIPDSLQLGGSGIDSGTEQGTSNLPEITTQEQFDALPSGAIFLEDGKQYRKP